MDWFKRYGIPGACFWGFLILWIRALYRCRIGNIINDDAVMRVVIAGIIGSFLPIGYLVSILGQILYLVIPCIGFDTNSRRRAGVFKSNSLFECSNEVKSVNLIMRCKNENLYTMDKTKFIQEWIRKRMDIVAISSSFILISVGIPFFVWRLGIIGRWDKEINGQWLWLARVITLVVFSISLLIYAILRKQIVKVQAEWFVLMASFNGPVVKKRFLQKLLYHSPTIIVIVLLSILQMYIFWFLK